MFKSQSFGKKYIFFFYLKKCHGVWKMLQKITVSMFWTSLTKLTQQIQYTPKHKSYKN